MSAKRLFLAVVSIAAFGLNGAFAKTDAVLEAQLASEALSTAAAGLSNAESARDRVAALTDTVRAYENGLSAMRDGRRIQPHQRQ